MSKVTPVAIQLRRDLNLRLGIKSSLSNHRPLIALLYVIYKTATTTTVEYSEEYAVGTNTKIRLKDIYFNAIPQPIQRSVIDSISLLSSQMESLQVGIELFYKLGKINFVDSGLNDAAERTGGNRYNKMIRFSLNMRILDIVLSSFPQADVSTFIIDWLNNRPSSINIIETNIKELLSIFSEDTQYSINNGASDIIFQREGVYQELLNGNTVDCNDAHEAAGPLRVLKSYFREGLNPFITTTANGLDLINANNNEFIKYSSMNSTSLDLSPKKATLYIPYAPSSSSSTKPITEQAIIYYGAPGTGKSHNINESLKNQNIPDNQIERVIFYPDYCYSDFIGGLQPIDEGGKPTYKFIAGPFTKILKEAVDNTGKQYFVVIEEINRGNPAAIFGDIFQLLDRASDGTSKYTITNKDIADYVYGDENKRVGLPSNLNILCTMNTADQNVFVLDSAFKRRFAMEYVPIDFSKLDPSNPNVAPYNDESSVFTGTKQIEDIFKNTDLQDYTSAVGTGLKRNWPTFAQIVNEKINIINKGGESISEDKKLGPFFVSIDEVHDRQKFADKVLYYLKQDVFKYVDTVLKPSYQKLYDDFVNKGADIFELIAKTE